MDLSRFKQRWKQVRHRAIKRMAPVTGAILGGYVRGSLWWLRLWPLEVSSAGMAFWARLFGPLWPLTKVARANLKAAFPEKSPQEIEKLVREVWANLGRLCAEFAHLDHIWDYDPDNPGKTGRIEIGKADFSNQLRDGRTALFFSAHTGNWEMCAIAGAEMDILDAVIYREPNNKKAAQLIEEMRKGTMPDLIRTDRDAARELIRRLGQGQHIGMLVDQYWTGGPKVKFFGRPTATNPTLAKLARHFDCPVYGWRVVRLPKGRFRVEFTEEVVMPRDAEGKIDVEGAMQAINDVIEGWVREHPAQWLWLHRRWR